MGKYESLITLTLVVALFASMGGCSRSTNETASPESGIQTSNDHAPGLSNPDQTVIDPQLPDGLTFDLIPVDNPVGDPVIPGSTHYWRFNCSGLGEGTVVSWETDAGYFVDENGKKSQSTTSGVQDLVMWEAPDTDGPVDVGVRASGPDGSDKIRVSVPIDSELRSENTRQPYFTPLFIEDESGRQLEVAAGELLVKFVSGTGIRECDAIFSNERIYPIAKMDIKGETIYRIWIDGNADLVEARDNLNKRADVEFCEFNYINHLADTPDDPFFAQKWDLQRMRVPQAWEIEDGSSDVIVAVIDTGVDIDHPELVNRVMDGMDFVPGGMGNGAEVDGDGIDNNFNGYTDENVGHGTHVAGIIGAEGYNGIGTVGVNLQVTIMPLKVFPIDGDGGASTSAIISAIDYARTNGAQIINLSLGSFYYSSSFRAAIIAAVDDGLNVVCAAGNSGVQDQFYPAAYDESIAVAAIQSSDVKSSFSNYGSWVDICSPGSSIYSTLYNDTYAYYSGTSMACPEVSGVLALIRACKPGFTGEEARQALQTGADASVYDANPSYIDKLGSGCADAYGALIASMDNPGLIDLPYEQPDKVNAGPIPDLHEGGFIPH